MLSLSLTLSNQAFDTLVRLRKERVLAAEELCYIYFQIQVRAGLQYVPLEPERCHLICVHQQTERALMRRKNQPDFKHYEPRIGYSDRLPKLVTLAR